MENFIFCAVRGMKIEPDRFSVYPTTKFCVLVFISDSRESSRPGVIFKKGVLKNFGKFTGKHQYQSQAPPATLLKKRLWLLFSCEFCEIFKNTFSYRTSPVATSG